MLDELYCRYASVLAWIKGIDDVMIFDNNHNLYVKGRKFKAQKVENSSFDEEDFVIEKNQKKKY